MNSSWYFLSYTLSSKLSGYGNGETIQLKKTRSICCNDTSNNTSFFMPTHFGTHLDFPYHFSESGHTGDNYQASDFVFDNVALIHVDMDEVENKIIQPLHLDLDSISNKTTALLINTNFHIKRAEREYWENGPGFSPELAPFLKNKLPKLRLIGFDAISLTNFQNRPLGRIAHKSFLIENNLLILEDMDFSPLNLSSKIQKMIVSPLRFSHADGAPATVFAKVTKND